jgi:hypothetical protein
MCSLIRCHELPGKVLIKINVLIFQTSFAVVFLPTLPLFLQGLLRPYLAVMKQSSSCVHNADSSSPLLIFRVHRESSSDGVL